MKLPKTVTAYDQTSFDPLQFINQVPQFEESQSSTGFCDLSQVIQRLQSWQENYLTIKPLLLLRRNDDPQVVRVASQFGCQFVCCSQGEAEELLRSHVPPEEIQWSNAMLTLKECKYAKSARINCIQIGRTTALHEIKAGHPEAK